MTNEALARKTALKLAEKLVTQWGDLTHKPIGKHHVLPRMVYKKLSPERQVQKVAQLIFDNFNDCLNEAVKEKDEALDKAISTGKELISQVASHIHVTRTQHYHKIFDELKD